MLKETKKQSKEEIRQSLANFVYESGILAKTPRSGLWFLGTGKQSVAEHTVRTVFITYILCYMASEHHEVDLHHAVMMALFHDFGEGRTSDHNYVHQKYGRLAEAEAINDVSKTVPFGDEIKNWFTESEEKKTLEAKLVKDADQIEWMATLREEETKGNVKAQEWIAITEKRLKTDVGQALGRQIIETHPDEWWFDGDNPWWVDRNEK